MLLRARYVVPVDSPPIENGAVLVEGDSIAAVGAASEFSQPVTEDFGDAVILPGFVNAHTHLELTHLAGQISPALGFVPWIQALAARLMRESLDPSIAQAAVAEGVRLSLRAGVTAVGDITREPAVVRPLLAKSSLRAVSFGEVIGIGLGRNRWPTRLDAAANSECASETLRIGISPHSPYTVDPEGILACVRRAEALAAPLCIHAAETPDEELFTQRLEGELVALLKSANVWDPGITAAEYTPVEWLERCGALTKATVLAHANYVSDDDIEFIAHRRTSVAYCPRTHAAFGHAPHRFRDMRRAGINVCLGTDSLASNPSLSILEELRFLRQNAADMPTDILLRMGTRNGALALGFGQRCGSLKPDKAADLVVIPLLRAATNWDSFLEDSAQPIAVYVAGRQTSLLG